MELLRRAIAVANTISASVLSSTFSAWFPAGGATEEMVSCIGAPKTSGSKPMPMGGFLSAPTEEIVIRVKQADLPGGTIPRPESQFFAGPTTTKADADKYKVRSIKKLLHLDGWVEITGYKSS